MSTTNNTEKKRYLAAEVGMDVNGKPHAFHVEGYISRPAYVTRGTEDKKSYLGTAIGTTTETEALMALADGSYEKGKEYGGGEFLSLNMFGSLAESFSKVCEVGLKVAVSGTFEWHDYTSKDGAPRKELRLLVDNLVVMGSRTKEGEISNRVGHATRMFADKDGVVHNQPYTELMTGEVIGAKGLKSSASGHEYLSFGVKTKIPAKKIYDLATGTYKDGNEYDTKKCIVNAVLFDRTAKALANLIRNGAQVVCSGAVTAREYNGETSYQMVPRVISIMKFAPKVEDENAANTGAAPTGSVASAGYSGTSDFVPMDDEDDELPF